MYGTYVCVPEKKTFSRKVYVCIDNESKNSCKRVQIAMASKIIEGSIAVGDKTVTEADLSKSKIASANEKNKSSRRESSL